MRGTVAKHLRAARPDRPHPGRKQGGTLKHAQSVRVLHPLVVKEMRRLTRKAFSSRRPGNG